MNKDKKVFFEEEPNFVNPNTRIFGQSRSIDYTIFIDGMVELPEYYRDETNLLMNATEDDTITILINSMGGSMQTAIQLFNAIRYSKANTQTVLTGSAMSAGSMLFLSADTCVVMPHSEMMIHNASTGVGGKIEDIHQYTTHTIKLTRAFLEDVYEGFLTAQEISDVARGMEIYLDENQITERLQARQKYLEESYKEKGKAMGDEDRMSEEELVKQLELALGSEVKIEFQGDPDEEHF